MRPYKQFVFSTAIIWMILTLPGLAMNDSEIPSTADRPMHGESARRHPEEKSPQLKTPPLPKNMTLDEVLQYADGPPPANYPDVVADDRYYHFIYMEKFEYRLATDSRPDPLGWELQAWYGGDFNKVWVKNEGEAVFDGPDEGETETDLLYSRLITPFWNFQIGAQYAYEWQSGDDNDRWSGVIAYQGLAPYKFELDNSLYLSEDGDVIVEVEAEYDIRITQRLVLQPLAEAAFSFQDIDEREIGAGLTNVNLDLRLRYEIKREFAPYLGFRYHFLAGETADIAEDGGRETDRVLFMTGLRFAF